MNIDMAALHAIVVDRGISFDDLLEDGGGRSADRVSAHSRAIRWTLSDRD